MNKLPLTKCQMYHILALTKYKKLFYVLSQFHNNYELQSKGTASKKISNFQIPPLDGASSVNTCSENLYKSLTEASLSIERASTICLFHFHNLIIIRNYSLTMFNKERFKLTAFRRLVPRSKRFRRSSRSKDVRFPSSTLRRAL